MKADVTQMRSLWLPLLALLSACSQSPDDRLVALGRCYKAAGVLEDRVLLQGVEIAIAQATRDLKIEVSPARFAMLINQKVNDDLYPAGSLTDSGHVFRTVSKWAGSSVCQDVKQQAIDAGNR